MPYPVAACRGRVVAGGGSAPFPSDIAGLLLRYGADGVLYQNSNGTTPATTAGDPVGYVTDLSGNGLHGTQSVSGSRLQYEPSVFGLLPSLWFKTLEATNLTLPAGLSVARDDCAVFASSVPLTRQTTTVAWNLGTSNQLALLTVGGGSAYALNSAGAGVTLSGTLVPSIAGPEVMCLAVDASGTNLTVNGNTVTATRLTSATITGGAIGGFVTGGSFNCPQQLLDFIVYSPCPSADDRARILAWLNARAASSVVLPTRIPAIVCHGNSITVPTATNWTQVLSGAIGAAHGSYVFAQGGKTTTTMLTETAALQRAYSAARSLTIFIPMEIINDINAGQTGAQAYTNYAALCQSWYNLGAQVIACTGTPTTRGAPAQQTEIDAANVLLRAGYTAFAHRLADLAVDPSLDDPADLTYYGDGIHPTTAGQAAIAACVKTEVNALGLS